MIQIITAHPYITAYLVASAVLALVLLAIFKGSGGSDE